MTCRCGSTSSPAGTENKTCSPSPSQPARMGRGRDAISQPFLIGLEFVHRRLVECDRHPLFTDRTLINEPQKFGTPTSRRHRSEMLMLSHSFFGFDIAAGQHRKIILTLRRIDVLPLEAVGGSSMMPAGPGHGSIPEDRPQPYRSGRHSLVHDNERPRRLPLE
jgi:hypothetical protein